MNKTITMSIAGMIIYFAVLLFAVTREKKNSTLLDYFFAGRTLPFWALSITFVASWWGAGSALSSADLAYSDGMGAFFYYGVPVLIATFLMMLGSGRIRRVGYLTQGAMMEARYSKAVAKLLSVMILIFMTFNAASQMVGIGDFFGSCLDLPYVPAILVGTAIVLIYSMFGGFRAVVLTDIIQFVLLTLSAVIVFAAGMHFCGGISGIEKAAADAHIQGYMNMGSGVHKYLAYVVTFGCSWCIQANVWQRISAARDVREAKKMTTMSFFVYIPLYLIVVLTGMAGFVLYPDGVPEGGVISSITTDYLSPVLSAVVFVGISAAIMSTMDSLINTAAMEIVIDLSPEDSSDEKRLRRSGIATLVVTLAALAIAIRIPSILSISWMASDVITTGVFVPMILGFFWRRGNSKGALASMICGLAFCTYNLLITLGAGLPSFWEQQSALQVAMGIAVSTAVYVAVSLMTEPEFEKADAFIRLAGEGKTGAPESRMAE
jgi:SSS family solute:Na+ symporter